MKEARRVNAEASNANLNGLRMKVHMTKCSTETPTEEIKQGMANALADDLGINRPFPDCSLVGYALGLMAYNEGKENMVTMGRHFQDVGNA